MFDKLFKELLNRFAELDARLRKFETWEPLALIKVSVDNVSNPPTDAELDGLFGTPTSVGKGFARIINDAGLNANNYLVVSNGVGWWYVALTVAV